MSVLFIWNVKLSHTVSSSMSDKKITLCPWRLTAAQHLTPHRATSVPCCCCCCCCAHMCGICSLLLLLYTHVWCLFPVVVHTRVVFVFVPFPLSTSSQGWLSIGSSIHKARRANAPGSSTHTLHLTCQDTPFKSHTGQPHGILPQAWAGLVLWRGREAAGRVQI